MAIPFALIGAVGSILSVVFILLTYKWSELPSTSEIELETWEMVRGDIGWDSDYRIKPKELRAFESSGLGAWLNRYLLFNPNGKIRAKLEINGPDVSAGSPWTNPEFEDYCESMGVRGDFEVVDVGPPILVQVEVESLDKMVARDFIWELAEVVKDSDLR